MVLIGWISEQCVPFSSSPQKTNGLSVHECSQHYNFLHFKLQQQRTNWRCITSFLHHIYTSKSTQEEDSKRQLRIGRAFIKRIKWVLHEKNQHSSTSNCYNEEPSTNAITQARMEPRFGEGLSRVLSGLNAATTRNASVQQWHISYLVIMGRNLYTHMSFQIY